MDTTTYRSWLSQVDLMTPEQRTEAIAAIENRTHDDQSCPHCGTNGVVRRGQSNGLLLKDARTSAETLSGIVEADHTYLLHSKKGE